MLIQYIKGKYIGEFRDVSQIINDVFPYINNTDVVHIKQILTKGCPSVINFNEASGMKSFIFEKGYQATFKMYPEIVSLLPVILWVLYSSLSCCHMAQGILVKPGKNTRVIFNASTKGSPHKGMLNKFTPTEFEASIHFSLAKMKLLARIYNWRISYLQMKIFLASS
jgi:hypothetical protein